VLLGLSLTASILVFVSRGPTDSILGGLGGVAGSTLILLCDRENRKQLEKRSRR
jgi:hypothetical protein